VSRQFREFREAKARDRWPVEFDLAGVPRDTHTRDLLKQQLDQEQEMPRSLSPNSFVAGKMVDINHPPQAAYNPRDHEYPKMLYHPTEGHPAWAAERKKIARYNALHPDKPEIMPEVPAKTIQVNSNEEEEAKLKAGWLLRAPQRVPEPEEEEIVDTDGAALCSRGCGRAPHRGSCKRVVTPEAA
jgi:hypothetical protein